jgi:hypothetical protein
MPLPTAADRRLVTLLSGSTSSGRTPIRRLWRPEALDLAAHPDWQFARSEADPAQVWGEAYFANHEPELARRAFTRALEVRK